MDAAAHYLEDAIAQIGKLKALAEGGIGQLSDEEFFRTIDPESNSVAIVMRHVGGNLRSRFTDFLTTDGEKPDRHRDGEFEAPKDASRGEVTAAWDAGFQCFEAAVRQLTPADLMREITIRGEAHTVIQALHRALTHLAYHVGQIVLLAKHLRGPNWRTLSIPRGQSEQFTGPRRF
jgi:hypothetical protein